MAEAVITRSVVLETKKRFMVQIQARLVNLYGGGAAPYGTYQKAADDMDIDPRNIYDINHGLAHRFTVERLIEIAAKIGLKARLSDVDQSQANTGS